MSGPGILQQHLRAVLTGDFHDDGQAQTGAVGFGAQRPVKGLEDQFALAQRHAGA